MNDLIEAIMKYTCVCCNATFETRYSDGADAFARDEGWLIERHPMFVLCDTCSKELGLDRK